MCRIGQPAPMLISTHAPAGGATIAGNRIVSSNIAISTHAPAGGATAKHSSVDWLRRVFLLTPLREGRPGRPPCFPASLLISTHAPAGGATDEKNDCWRRIILFLLTPLREGRHVAIEMVQGMGQFLLTPLREGRRILLHFIIEQQHFYSRPCGRGDAENKKRLGKKFISTHAPAGGAT